MEVCWTEREATINKVLITPVRDETGFAVSPPHRRLGYMLRARSISFPQALNSRTSGHIHVDKSDVVCHKTNGCLSPPESDSRGLQRGQGILY